MTSQFSVIVITWPSFLCVSVFTCPSIKDLSFRFGLPPWLRGKDSTGQCRKQRSDSWVGRILLRRKWQPTPVFFPGKSHEQRSLVGYSPWGHKESDTTEQLNNKEMLCGPLAPGLLLFAALIGHSLSLQETCQVHVSFRKSRQTLMCYLV